MLPSRRVDIIHASDPRLDAGSVVAPSFFVFKPMLCCVDFCVRIEETKALDASAAGCGSALEATTEAAFFAGPGLLTRTWAPHEIAGHKNIPPRCTQVEDMGLLLPPLPDWALCWTVPPMQRCNSLHDRQL